MRTFTSTSVDLLQKDLTERATAYHLIQCLNSITLWQFIQKYLGKSLRTIVSERRSAIHACEYCCITILNVSVTCWGPYSLSDQLHFHIQSNFYGLNKFLSWIYSRMPALRRMRIICNALKCTLLSKSQLFSIMVKGSAQK